MKQSPLDPEVEIGTPIKYEMRGYNTLLGSHYDHYYLIYDWFFPEQPTDDVFQLPRSKYEYITNVVSSLLLSPVTLN